VPVELIFWVSLGCIVYIYAGFPLGIWIVSRWFARPVRKAPIEPHVCLLIAAYNEEAVIEEKIRNALALDYPEEKLEIVIASDGSRDATVAIASKFASRRVRVIEYPENRGKLAVLNDSIPQLTGEIVAFSDASSLLDGPSLRNLVMHFADPAVGAVSSRYKVRPAEGVELGRQEDLYWRYETFLKTQEGRIGSVLGCHGALYAIRKSLYPSLPAGTINDDYIIPVRILQQGYRVTYEPDAVASEEAHGSMGGFGRRVRIMTGNFEQLAEIRPLLSPVQPLSAFFFLSHKAGRLLVPVAMMMLLAANLLLLEKPLYTKLAGIQVLFYSLVLFGAVFPLRPLLRMPYYFCMINAASFLGIYHALSGKRRPAWK
jgi:cellulose synthase/poly-beta-1,6-N-acetylglucosamine synthase-like glycosyltransferase